MDSGVTLCTCAERDPLAVFPRYVVTIAFAGAGVITVRCRWIPDCIQMAGRRGRVSSPQRRPRIFLSCGQSLRSVAESPL